LDIGVLHKRFLQCWWVFRPIFAHPFIFLQVEQIHWSTMLAVWLQTPHFEPRGWRMSPQWLEVICGLECIQWRKQKNIPTTYAADPWRYVSNPWSVVLEIKSSWVRCVNGIMWGIGGSKMTSVRGFCDFNVGLGENKTSLKDTCQALLNCE